jgi:hypothetical protein
MTQRRLNDASIVARRLSYSRIGAQPNCAGLTFPVKYRGQDRGGEKIMANNRYDISLLTGIVRGESIQPVWCDRDCATVCGVGSCIQWATPHCESRMASMPPTSRARLFPFPLLRWRRRQSSPCLTAAMRPKPVREPHAPASPHNPLPVAHWDCWPMPPAVLPSHGLSGRLSQPGPLVR